MMNFLYFISDWVLYPLVYHVLRYRRRLVRKQLAGCDLTDDLLDVERRFYHTLCDYIVETLRLMHMSEAEARRRVEWVGIGEMSERMLREGKYTSFVYLAHFGNWEWLSSAGLWMHPEFRFAQIYHPLHNKFFDRLFLRMRQRNGGKCISMKTTLRHVITSRRQGIHEIVGVIADQCPKANGMRHSCTFLGRKTAFITGAELLSKRVPDSVAYYLEVTRPRRGYYRAELKPISLDPSSVPDFQITDAYARMLERSVRQHPHLWLWTHNRWKRV